MSEDKNWDNQIGGNHYRTTDGEQHWDMIIRLFGLEAARGYFVGNATKYLTRAHIKEEGKNELNDVKKALHYINKWISVLEKEGDNKYFINCKTENSPGFNTEDNKSVVLECPGTKTYPDNYICIIQPNSTSTLTYSEDFIKGQVLQYGIKTGYLIDIIIVDDVYKSVESKDSNMENRLIQKMVKYRLFTINTQTKELTNIVSNKIESLIKFKQNTISLISDIDLVNMAKKLFYIEDKTGSNKITFQRVGDKFKAVIEEGKYYKFIDSENDEYKYIIKILKSSLTKIDYEYIRLNNNNDLIEKSIDSTKLSLLNNLEIECPTTEEINKFKKVWSSESK